MTINLSKSSLCVTLAGALVLPPGCATQGGDDPTTDVDRSYSGEELFLAVFFADGPAADLFPELRAEMSKQLVDELTEEQRIEAEKVMKQAGKPHRLSGDQRAQLDEIESAVLGHIRDADPTFFERFADDLRSGDHFLVDAALSEGADHLQTGLALHLGVDPADLAAGADQQRCISFAALVATVFAYAFAVHMAYAYNMVVAVNMVAVFDY